MCVSVYVCVRACVCVRMCVCCSASEGKERQYKMADGNKRSNPLCLLLTVQTVYYA